jgi:ADP-heptose:LPS heptosyltransferase
MSQNQSRPLSKDQYGLVRRADKWLGSALLFLLGFFFPRRRSPPADIRTVIIMKFDGIGDAVLVTGVARDLRAALPGVRLILVCGPFNYPMVLLLSAFDELVCLSLGKPWQSAMELRRLKADVCLDLGEWSRIEALLTFFSGARWTIGFNTRGQYRHYAYDACLPLRLDQHELDNYRSLVRKLGMKTGHQPLIELTSKAQKMPVTFTPRRPFAILHLWSGSATWAHLKEWPFDRWCELAQWLNNKGLMIYLTGGNGDKERAVEFIAQCQWDNLHMESVAGLDFITLIRMIEKAAIVVSIDTSITHIAGALGVKVLSLHGPSSSKRWGPVGPQAEAIDTPLPGCGYMNWGADSNREKARLKCMEGISTQEVIERVEAMLNKPVKT